MSRFSLEFHVVDIELFIVLGFESGTDSRFSFAFMLLTYFSYVISLA